MNDANTIKVSVSYNAACDCCGSTRHMGEDEIFCYPCKARRKTQRANAPAASSTPRRARKLTWKRCAELANLDTGVIDRVLGTYEGDASGNQNEAGVFDNEWWLVARLTDGRFGVLWGNDGATCSHCGAFRSGYAEAEWRMYDTEQQARDSVPVGIELT